MIRLLLPLLLTGCIAHAPTEFSGPDQLPAASPWPVQPVEILEDAAGVPHIRAASAADALYAQGLLHAEERLFQMDLNRRVSLGRLSELLGKRTLETDRFIRTVGFNRAAQAALDALPPEERLLLDAYVAGVNASIDSLDTLPPEYRILGVRPEPWTALDSLAWTKSMAWLLSASGRDDSLWDALVAEFGPQQAGWFLPDYPDDAPVTLPGDQMRELRGSSPPAAAPSKVGSRSGAQADVLAAFEQLLGKHEVVGSNAWVVHGSRTATDRPILANDPHLAVSEPSIWYLVHLECPEFDAIGTSFPGLPGVVIGHNRDIAWGFTNAPVDVMDLYRERLSEDGASVQREAGWEPLEVVDEIISVRGGKDRVERVRISSRGPLVTEFFKGYDEEVALRWTALDDDDRALSAFFGLLQASDWDEFLEALRGFGSPPQNAVYADRSGHVGWKVPGRVPTREGFDGRGAGRGWVEAEAWGPYIPYAEMPQALDPQQGFIVTANNQVVPPDWVHWMGDRFASPHRAQRILGLIEEGAGRDLAGNRALQLDVVSAQVDDVLPLLRSLEPEDPLEQSVVATLANWDGSHDVESAAAVIYNAWLVEILELLGKDRLGELWSRWGGTHGTFLRGVFAGQAWPLCLRPAGKNEPATSSCGELAALALTRITKDLKKRLGPDPTLWRWGDVHGVRFGHRLSITPHLKAKLDTHREAPGGSWTVNIGAFPHKSPFGQTWHASYRQIIDLSDWDNSLWVFAPGQSGVPWRAHYRDLVDPWIQGEMMPMSYSRAAVDAAAVRTRTVNAAE